MTFESWHAFYYAPWQSPWALLVVPFAWGIFRVVVRDRPASPGVARFVRVWAALFLIETMLDPVANALVADAASFASTAVGLTFVLLGDFRIYWLVFALAEGASTLAAGAGRAALATLVVPIAAYAVNAVLGVAMGEVPGQVLWLVHESLFVAVCFFLAWRWVPANVAETWQPFARRVLGYVAAYYALWAAADVLILAGIDAGWLVRCVPNQLYYAFTVPFVELVFWLRPASSAAARTSVHAAR